MPECVALAGGGLCRPAREFCWFLSRFSSFLVWCLSSLSSGQASHSEQVQIKPPLLRAIDPPAPDATAADLEARAEQLRAGKLYLDALDYYRAALAKKPNSRQFAEQDRNHRVDDAALSRGEEVVRSIDQTDRKFADAYNNRGVVFYEERKYGAAVKEYRRAIALDEQFGVVLQQSGSGAVRQKGV